MTKWNATFSNLKVKKDLQVNGDLTIKGDMTFGDATTDTITVTGAATFSSTVAVSGATTFSNTVTVGQNDTGYDVKFFGATSGAYWLWDESADAMLLAGDARIDLSSATVNASNTDGGVIKCGTSASPVTEDTANMKFMSFYFDNGATSGDNRGMYLGLYLTGAGGGGEAARIFTTCNDVACGTAHGAHISLNFGSTGSVTGLGVASRNTIHVPDTALSGGTYAATQAEIYADGSSSDISGATKYSFIRVVADGDATGKANIEDNAYLFEINTGSNASGNLVSAAGDEPTWTSNTYLIRCDLNGQTAYLVAVKTS